MLSINISQLLLNSSLAGNNGLFGWLVWVCLTALSAQIGYIVPYREIRSLLKMFIGNLNFTIGN